MTDPTAVLRAELADLVRDAEASGIKLVLIGGFGVLLRVELAGRRKVPTLAQRSSDEGPMLPVARATRDLDLLLAAELIVDPAATQRLREVLDARGYEPVPEAKYYQFQKIWREGVGDLVIKVDAVRGGASRQCRREEVGHLGFRLWAVDAELQVGSGRVASAAGG